MAWLVGIDEAGYGPNLGPLVLTSIAVRVPDGCPPLADVLRPAVRRAAEEDDGRLLIDDSKQVYVGPNGLAKLERGVLPVVAAEPAADWTLADYLRRLGAHTSEEDVVRESWFHAPEPLPVAITPEDWAETARRVADVCCGAGVLWGPARSVVMPAPRFNALLDRWQNKSAVEAVAVIALLGEVRLLPGHDPVNIAVDRLGGRTHYAAMIQEAFPDGWVMTHEECAGRCRYSLLGLEREMTLCFQPRAEGEHLPVALASMACKYLREVCMMQFNRFWRTNVPGLEPTAGYPGDAARFFRAIGPAMRQLGLAADQVWRRK